MIAAIVGVVALAVLVMAFLATKVWDVWHVTTLVLFFFATLGYAILASRTLEKRLGFQKKEYDAQTQREEQEALTATLRRGAPASASQAIGKLASRDVLSAQSAQESGGDFRGVVQLEHELRVETRVRGRAWRSVAPTGPPDPKTGFVPVRFAEPAPEPTESAEAPVEGEAPPAEPAGLTIAVDSIVYVFEEGKLEGAGEGGRPRLYIGEFRVAEVQDREAVLEPLDQLELDPDAQQRLLESRGPWAIYETMPADDRDLFAGFDEAALRSLLPEGSAEEYVRDRGPTTEDDPLDRREPLDADGNVLPPDAPEEQVAKTRYRRRLRDYALLLNDLERERAALVAREQAITSDLQKLAAALAGAKRTEAYRREELGKWQADLDAVERDRRAIERHTAALRDQIATAKRLLDATLQENAQIASARATQRGPLAPIGPGELDVNAL